MHQRCGDIDEQVAAALAGHGEDMLDQARADTDRSLRALLDAFRYGRWGSYWCLFSDPTAALRRLIELSELVFPHMLRLPQATSLVGRLLEAAGDMAMVVVAAERADRENEVRGLRELLEVKDDFLRQTVHDLRRPLGVARGYFSLIEDGSLSDVAALREGSTAINAALSEMGTLLNGLAAIARLDDRAEVLQQALCHVQAVVSSAADSVQAEATAKSIQLKLHADPDLQVRADAERLRVAVTNLLVNAVRYAPPQSVVVVEVRSRIPGVSIAVTDQGPGIEPVEAERVFEKHRRGAAAGTDASGLGLGLYIVRRIIELHGGLVTLESVPGQGSTFTILLPS